MNTFLKTVLWILGAAFLFLALWYFSTLITYILIAAIISFIGAPLVRLLQKIKVGKITVPAWLAATLTLSAFLLLIGLFFSMFAPLVAEEAHAISQIDYDSTAKSIEGSLAQTEQWLEQFNLSGDEQSNQDYILQEIKGVIDFGQLSLVFNNIFSVMGNAFVAIFSILFIAFFFLKDTTLLVRAVLTLTPEGHVDRIQNILDNSGHLLTRYFLGLVVQIGITTVIISIGLSVLGVKNALVIGFLAGIFNLIPYVGPIMGAIIGILLTITSQISLGHNLQDLPSLIGGIATVFLLAQLVDNFFTQPVVLGNSVKAHPLEIFLVISVAATLAGITGMIAAIPVYTILRVVAKEFLSKFKAVKTLTRDL